MLLDSPESVSEPVSEVGRAFVQRVEAFALALLPFDVANQIPAAGPYTSLRDALGVIDLCTRVCDRFLGGQRPTFSPGVDAGSPPTSDPLLDKASEHSPAPGDGSVPCERHPCLGDLLLYYELQAAGRLHTEPLPPSVRGELNRGRTNGYKVTFQVTEGDRRGCRCWKDFWLTGAALPMTKRDLAKFGITDLAQLERPLPEGITARVTVRLRMGDNNTQYNEIRSTVLPCTFRRANASQPA
jgi:hypothetical protein